MFSKDALGFVFDFGFESISVPAQGVTREEADYNEINEINHFLSIERDIDREEDFKAEKSASGVFAG